MYTNLIWFVDIVVCFEESEIMVIENQGSAMIQLALTRASSFNVTLSVIATDGTATGQLEWINYIVLDTLSLGGVDYDAGPYSVMISAGQTSGSLTLQLYDNNILETDKTFTLSIDTSSLPSTIIRGPNCILRATILDDDGMYMHTLHWIFYIFNIQLLDITVNFEQITYNIAEANGLVNPVLVLSNPSSTNITVEILSTEGSATGKYSVYILFSLRFKICFNHIGGADFSSGPYIVIFLPGMTRTQFDVLIMDDNILEYDETFELRINASSLPNRVSVGSVQQATVNISDEDSKFV